MQFGALIIGDEILSGKRQDKHLAFTIEALSKRGLELAWCDYLGDVPAQIIATLQRTFNSEDIVFSFGGIGATPDDHTRRCAAEAAGQPLIRHPQAVAEIEAQYGEAAYPNRILMAELPQTSQLIPNPINRVPGFSLNHHHFLPGFPEMAWPMLEWVLDTDYSNASFSQQLIEQILILPNARESDLIPCMNEFVQRFPKVRFSSLPSLAQKQIELGVRGNPQEVAAAITYLKSQLKQMGYSFQDK